MGLDGLPCAKAVVDSASGANEALALQLGKAAVDLHHGQAGHLRVVRSGLLGHVLDGAKDSACMALCEATGAASGLVRSNGVRRAGHRESQHVVHAVHHFFGESGVHAQAFVAVSSSRTVNLA
ncbi:hypothetical protein D3C86_1465730 [compost metagenome]